MLFRSEIISKVAYSTPDLAVGSPEYTKNFKYLYIFFNVIESTVTVQASFDYSTSYDFSQTVNVGQVGALYDTAVYDTDVYPSINYKVARVELNRSARAVKLRFTESSANSFGIIGWTIVYVNEDWRQ